MAELASYLNADKNKVRIGCGGLGGYAEIMDAFLSTGNEGAVLGAGGEAKVKGGTSGVGSLDGMSIKMLDDILIDDQEKKQAKLDLACAYAFPMKSKTGGGYYMAASLLGDSKGVLAGQYKGIPSSFDNATIEALEPPNSNLQVGVGLDLDSWVTGYMNEFFNGTTVTSRDLQVLAQKNKLCAEVVIHSGAELNTSGKVVFANVVDLPATGGKTCYISPYFCFGKYKELGLDFAMTTKNGVQGMQTSADFEPASTPSYDYKTGELSRLGKSALQGFAATGSGNAVMEIAS